MNEKLKKILSKNYVYIIIGVFLLSIVSMGVILFINKESNYPWGSEIYDHLLKVELLSKQLRNDTGYNIAQIFNSFTPIAYYIMASINIITTNVIMAFNLYIGLVIIIGGMGFIRWGICLNRKILGVAFAVAWFFTPFNSIITFDKGSIPIMLSLALLPHLVLTYSKVIESDKIKKSIVLSMMFFIMTLNDFRVIIVFWTGLLLYSIIKFCLTKRFINNIRAITYSFLGMMVAGFWVIPQLDFSQYLNTLYKFNYNESFYWGLSSVLIIIFGVLFSKKKEKPGFIFAFIIFLWMNQVTLPMNLNIFIIGLGGIAILLTLVSLMEWRTLRKSIVIIIGMIVIGDSLVNFIVLDNFTDYPRELSKTIDIARKHTYEKMAVVDNSTFKSFPSYYIYQKDGNFQEEIEEKKLDLINAAALDEYYGTMFDRILDLGIDSVIVAKSMVTDAVSLRSWGSRAGYKLVGETDKGYIFNYPIDYAFESETDYKGIGIGKYATNIINLFPNFILGENEYIDNYSIDDFKEYDSILLSGFKYKDKKLAEDIINELGKQGKKIVIDTTELPGNEFMGVSIGKVRLTKSYGNLKYKGRIINTRNFIEGEFNCTYILNGDNEESYLNSGGKKFNYIYEVNENTSFLGLNIPYYTSTNRNSDTIEILEDLLGMESFNLPKRKIVENVSDSEINSTLIKDNEPYGKSGIIISLIAILLILTISIVERRYSNE